MKVNEEIKPGLVGKNIDLSTQELIVLKGKWEYIREEINRLDNSTVTLEWEEDNIEKFVGQIRNFTREINEFDGFMGQITNDILSDSDVYLNLFNIEEDASN